MKIKDFLHLAVLYDMKFGKDKIYHKIMSASIAAGLKRLKPKEEREIIFLQWIEVINLLKKS